MTVSARANSYPDLSVFRNAEVVPDSELAEMRGRFVKAGKVKYFGVKMYTLWQTNKGAIMAVGLDWKVDLPDGANGMAVGNEPKVSVFHFAPDIPEPSVAVAAEGPGPKPKPLSITADAGGLESAQGVVQGIIAAGDLNSVGQDININVLDDVNNGSDAASPGPVGVPQVLEKTTTLEFSSGLKTTVFLEDNAIGFVVEEKNKGRVMQEIRGGIGHAAQFVNLDSHANVIQNLMNINIGVDRSGFATRANVEAAIHSVRQLLQ